MKRLIAYASNILFLILISKLIDGNGYILSIAPLAIPSLISAGGGLVQTLGGLFGKKPKRPKITVPDSVKQATTTARQLANTSQRPGADIAEQQIEQATANTVGAASNVSSSATDVLGALSRANIQEQRAKRQEAMTNAQFNLQSKNNLISQLNQQGQYENQAQMQNKLAPYLEKRRQRADLINSGLSNIQSGAESFVSTGMLGGFEGSKMGQMFK